MLSVWFEVVLKCVCVRVCVCLQEACREPQPVCGQNSETYNTVCEAFSDRVAVDYEGPCHSVGAGADYAVGSGCDLVVCPPPSNPLCVPVTPPGGCKGHLGCTARSKWCLHCVHLDTDHAPCCAFSVCSSFISHTGNSGELKPNAYSPCVTCSCATERQCIG